MASRSSSLTRSLAIYPPPPCFSQVLILKICKVICFDALLQVLILKGFNASGELRVASGEKNLRGGVTPLSRVFAYEWQGKDLRDTECVRVASKGLTKRDFCASVQRANSRRGTPTPGGFAKEAATSLNQGTAVGKV